MPSTLEETDEENSREVTETELNYERNPLEKNPKPRLPSWRDEERVEIEENQEAPVYKYTPGEFVAKQLHKCSFFQNHLHHVFEIYCGIAIALC